MRQSIILTIAVLLVNFSIGLTAYANQTTTYKTSLQTLQSIINQTKQIKTPSGLTYQVLNATNGKKPTSKDEVEIRFTSYNQKGEVLEGTLNNVPVILPINQMFIGLQESLLLMPVGSTYEFDIPAHLGYEEEGKTHKQAVKYRIELLNIIP